MGVGGWKHQGMNCIPSRPVMTTGQILQEDLRLLAAVGPNSGSGLTVPVEL